MPQKTSGENSLKNQIQTIQTMKNKIDLYYHTAEASTKGVAPLKRNIEYSVWTFLMFVLIKTTQNKTLLTFIQGKVNSLF